MKGSKTLVAIQKSELLSRVQKYFDQGYRMAQICCVKEPAGQAAATKLEMSYSFDKDHAFETLRFDIAPTEEIPSITPIYDGAYLYENELHDLYGIPVKGINIDFKGTFYKVAIPAPFNPACGCGDPKANG
ncbi:MAG TPA: NADH-quinone oxidoreductase subunit C [Spirochaetota bacterium]